MDESKYITAGYKVIEEEGLSKPKAIVFTYCKNGTIRKLGGIWKNRYNDEYKIKINTTKANFVLDKNGRYMDKKGNKYRREPKLRSDEEILDTLAHEIAHVKFWNHDAQHKSYTNHIKLKLRTEVMPHEN